MRVLSRTAALVACLGFGLGLSGCTVEDKSDASTPGSATKVEVELGSGPSRPIVDVDVHKEGAFERLGERMDVGAQKLDKGLEKGAEKLGEAMQNAGQKLEENSEQAQRRRQLEEAAEPVKVEVNINQP